MADMPSRTMPPSVKRILLRKRRATRKG